MEDNIAKKLLRLFSSAFSISLKKNKIWAYNSSATSQLGY
jgi:hypothetical protein